MFQVDAVEAKGLRSQSVTLNSTRVSGANNGRGHHSKYAPYVFTEHGIALLSSVLRSNRAVEMDIEITRAFIRMREMLISHKDLAVRWRRSKA